MAAGGSFNCFVEEKLGKFPHLVIYAVLEWVVIILLFFDGFLAFVCNEFARFFDLQIPCLLCTRIDHVLVHRDSHFYYNDSICENHKKDISSLAYCNVHRRLSDIRTMCQGCLISFATDKDPELDKYKSLFGLPKKDVELFDDDDRKFLMKPSRKDDLDVSSLERSGNLRCSCCGEPLRSNSGSKQSRSVSMNAPPSSPRAPQLGSINDEDGHMDLPPIRYTELKLVADSELELLEDEDAPSGNNSSRAEVKSTTVPLIPHAEDINDYFARTPSTRTNKFFGIPLSDSVQMSPRWGRRKPSAERLDFLRESNEAKYADADILTRLKRQIRLDRKALKALQMELDEERSASAVAANNAMAMITRLQAEKASVQMEALQYQRMTEEQAEYDREALQQLKDMIYKREEEIKALESDLEIYREKYGTITKVNTEMCEIDYDDDQDTKSQALSMFSEKSDNGSISGGDHMESERPYEQSTEYRGGNSNESSLDFERERCYLEQLLRDLEQKVDAPPLDESSNPTVIPDALEGDVNKAILANEVSWIRERLKAIEADSSFLKQAAMTLQRGSEGTNLLTEIVQHLRRIRHQVEPPLEVLYA